ncbi:MAG: hypothetical protein UW21_C0018G0002 [Candidatus Woesebacteria bacterium GW2011_GWB1_44_11b]|uniref:Ribose 5-phosphate isomerase n=1 Tax=Candidatus Woesebacteria bacterium GW2011_GWB1_44_11b TaxID=1618580 RepID=A0A0G1GD24_9BACT|nr:MAG: hypothetical protein UW21_C0018G0002 [Candidatus Woesebacteria bacterium GW2011_GWB1_44_11b]
MKIYLGADHRGYKLKEEIAKRLFEGEYGFEDLGADHLDPKDDYTVYAERVASVVASEKEARGILICGSGVGVDVAANKFDGIRASIGKNAQQVIAGRRDDDMNILVLAADFTKANEAQEMVKAFLETKFDGLARHKKRLREIRKLEANN